MTRGRLRCRGWGEGSVSMFELFPDAWNDVADLCGQRRYRNTLTVAMNRKGVVDVDTVKGCQHGMAAYPNGGCYGECYAAKTASMYGINFNVSVIRRLFAGNVARIVSCLHYAPSSWYRIGTAGDPSFAWEHTVRTCETLHYAGKTAVIITKHWNPLEDVQIARLALLGAVVNTSVSALDTDEELNHRLLQLNRLREAGVRSVCRVVTCAFGGSPWATDRAERQRYLLSLAPVIDNPLRAGKNNPLAKQGEILVTKRKDAVGGGHSVSVHCPSVYLGTCENCPDQCGVVGTSVTVKGEKMATAEQLPLFPEQTEFVYCKSVIGSGYEKDIAALALEDGIACRAARKNMQIHSAIVLKYNGAFAGFMTFQDNAEVNEFCLLQSVIKPDLYTPELYRRMVETVIAQNAANRPAIITTDPKSKFETPRLFESLGFVTYLKMSGFCYMVKGTLADVRLKLLAHITMTNVWNSIKGDWLHAKKGWNSLIEQAGERAGIANPKFASREGCWQGENGFANVVTGHSHNGNASVLDPVACEVILRFFMPTDGRRVYNPFGGGVQFGFVTGFYGYEYVSSEIRQNQCDANNALCAAFASARWIKSDSSTYDPDGMFDLVFTCPPYYKVEEYLDYDGKAPAGEINSLESYDEFRDTLFAGYRKAIAHLNDNRFFVVMTGDSRDKNGAYHCSEAETVMFFKGEGLSVYNQIVYLECEFTRLAHAKKTLNMRKFPKREQKIIVAYKGDISKIKDLFPKVGRL